MFCPLVGLAKKKKSGKRRSAVHPPAQLVSAHLPCPADGRVAGVGESLQGPLGHDERFGGRGELGRTDVEAGPGLG